MKKTITFSLLFAASAICAYADDSALEAFYTNSGPVTLDGSDQSLPKWTDSDSADALVSTTVSGANAGDKLAQIDFSFEFKPQVSDAFNLISVMSTGGSAYSVGASAKFDGRTTSLTVNLATGVESKGTLSYAFAGTATKNFSLTLTQGTDAGSVVVMLSDGTNAISFTSENADLFTGNFSNIVVGGANAANKGSVTVTSIKARKAQNDDNNDAVPEPTTATLSLLALAGLAARRRRCK